MRGLKKTLMAGTVLMSVRPGLLQFGKAVDGEATGPVCAAATGRAGAAGLLRRR